MTLNINKVSKSFGKDKYAIKDFSIQVDRGVLGLLGPNGAGKSTLLKMIATATKPSTGSIHLDNKDLSKSPNYMRKQLGYLPQDFGVYPYLNAVEFLSYLAALKGLSGRSVKERIEHILSGLNLLHAARIPIGKYSGGMRQRIGIAQAILNEPTVLLLDEPTVGLDPAERVGFRNMISDLGKNAIVILSTHIVSDIDTVADKVAIMSEGKLICKSDISSIVQKVENCVFETSIDKSNFESFSINNTIISHRRSNDQYQVRYISKNDETNGEPKKATLEDAFLFLTKTASHV